MLKTGRPAIVQSPPDSAITTESQFRFTVSPYRVSFLALEETAFPSVAANAIRGALGDYLHRSGDKEAFQYFRPDPQSRSGFADPPRPFVVRAAHLNSLSVSAGERFSFDVHFFGQSSAILQSFAAAFRSWKEDGLGVKRSRVQLAGIQRLGRDRNVTLLDAPVVIHLTDDPGVDQTERATIEFLTATELKHRNELVSRPEFPILFARLRDRIRSLASFYDEGFDGVDAEELSTRAEGVRLVDCAVEWISEKRRSSRTGQIHPLGGFTGTAVYEGSLSPFLSWLEAGYWTGVGRQTVWGKGVIEVRSLKSFEALL
jgi:hypothetical protein